MLDKLVIHEFNVRKMITFRDSGDCIDLYDHEGSLIGEINPDQARQISEFCLAFWVRHASTMTFTTKEDDNG